MKGLIGFRALFFVSVLVGFFFGVWYATDIIKYMKLRDTYILLPVKDYSHLIERSEKWNRKKSR